MRFSRLGVFATVIAATASLALAAALAPRAHAPAELALAAVARCSPAGSPTGRSAILKPTADDRRAGARDADRRAARRHGRAGQPGRIRALRRRRRMREGQGRRPAAADLPVVGVSWLDATAYAEFYARRPARTGACRPTRNGPTPRPNASAASRRPPRAATTSPAAGSPSSTPIRRWRASRRRRSRSAISASTRSASPIFPATSGSGRTPATSGARSRPNGDARLLTRNCRVRALEGEHRTFMSDFIRDGLTGGCSVGPPPTNLGFRLVRSRASAVARVISGVGALFAAL